MPPILIRPGLALALMCCPLAARAEGKAFTFPEHDLEFTTPPDWRQSPPETGVVVVVHDQIPQKIGGDTSIGSKAVALMVSTFPKEVAIDTAAFADRQREAMQEKGAVVVGSGQRTIGPLIFHTTKIANHEMERPVSYLCTTFGNDRAVTLVLSSRSSDPSMDPQLKEILRSLHFLSPYRPVTELTRWRRVKEYTAHHHMAVIGLSVVGLAALAVFVMILRQSDAELRESRPATRKL